MINEGQLLRDLFVALLSLGEYSFPKQCSKCGKVYGNLSELLRHTEGAMESSGVVQAEAGAKTSVVGVFRNCNCGASLVVLFRERRDRSEEGVRKRETFGRLLEVLKAAGVGTDVARQELFKVLYGHESELLNKLLESAGDSTGRSAPSV